MGCMSSNNVSIQGNPNLGSIKAGVKQLRQLYDINPKVLGAGSFGKVFVANNRQNPSHKVAIKVISKTKLSQNEIESIRQEVAILSTLDHPNIVKYYETYEDQKYIYLVMELCSGGELMEKLSERNEPFSEKEAAFVVERLLRAIIHCNSSNITHRDIKPENIMYDNGGEVKLIDFGLAKQTMKKNQQMHTVAGTPYFIAPEVLTGDYGKECDIWSYGVVLFLILSAQYPFDGSSRAEVFAKIQSGNFDFPKKPWDYISSECKDLIKKMLLVDRKKRITAEKALKHPWFQIINSKERQSQQIIDPHIMKRLKEFKGSSKLKKAALNVLVKMLNPKDIQNLREQFQRIDTDNSGFIELSELEEAIKQAKYDLTAKEIRSIIQELDYSGNQKINYTEFLAATISVQKILTHERLEALFKQFDVENKDEITSENIKAAMSKLGKQISDEELEEIMRKHDASGDKAISLDEFKKMMLENA